MTLVHTRATEGPQERLAKVLREKGVRVDRVVRVDAADATSVTEKLGDLLGDPGVHLNYTGGTKVMAAQALNLFYRRGGCGDRASYLDERGEGRGPCLRFDSGERLCLPGKVLDLDTLFALHGYRPKTSTPTPPEPTPQDAEEILGRVLDEPGLVNELCQKKKEAEELKWRLSPSFFRAEDLQLKLSQARLPPSQPVTPNEKEARKWLKQWFRFLAGGWLERWLYERIGSLLPEAEVHVGVEAFRAEEGTGGQVQFEVDVVAIHGARSYFVSCSTKHCKPQCKLKLFEISIRARQLGGDLARAALVCLADRGHTRELNRDIEDLWGASNTPRVFGREDLERWSRVSDTGGLEEWLES